MPNFDIESWLSHNQIPSYYIWSRFLKLFFYFLKSNINYIIILCGGCHQKFPPTSHFKKAQRKYKLLINNWPWLLFFVCHVSHYYHSTLADSEHECRIINLIFKFPGWTLRFLILKFLTIRTKYIVRHNHFKQIELVLRSFDRIKNKFITILAHQKLI